MSYSRHWDCERCGKRQESIDWPDVRVCERCVGAEIVVTREMASSNSILTGVATRAYDRGYRHGREVERRSSGERAIESMLPSAIVRSARAFVVAELREAAGPDGAHGSSPSLAAAADFLEERS